MGLILFLFYVALFSVLIAKWSYFRVNGINKLFILGAFYLKLAAGFVLALLYSDHYEDRGTGDAFRFYDDALVMHRCLEEKGVKPYLKLLTGIGFREDSAASPYYFEMTHLERAHSTGYVNDNATMIRANAVVLHFSRGHYHVHTAFWCFMAMIGLTAMLKLFVGYFPRKRVAMFFSVFLLPTTLFWGSGVLKEPILLMGLGLFLLGFFRFLFDESKFRHIIYILLGLFFLIISKGYVLFLMLPAIVGLLLVKAFRGRRFWLWFSIPHLAAALFILVGPLIGGKADVAHEIGWKQTSFYNEATLSGAGSVIDIPKIDSAADIFLNAPNSLKNIYLRPWITEGDNILYLPAALENLLLMICLAVMLWNFRRPYGLGIPLIAFGISFVLALGVLIGGVVPVLGALVRYKMPALIFLFALTFAMTDHIKLQRRLPFIRKIVKTLWRKPY
ncbi:MAG: hypothetical protein ABR572_05100 [Cryomorphaceae bacterium]|nr:hypothetical protein [Flavobacteriales bacterium]